jgi:hypothetical protein
MDNSLGGVLKIFHLNYLSIDHGKSCQYMSYHNLVIEYASNALSALTIATDSIMA